VTIRVDGNDIFAVYNATKAARDIAITQSRPVLIEAMTYRIGHHSTSDDSTAYRSIDEINSWEKGDNPMLRFRNYLITNNMWDLALDEQCHKDSRQTVRLARPKVALKKKIYNLFSKDFEKRSESRTG
jgi:2-oxoisovalerate dehydrogenase E1 component alpha subunit